jgi:hypothetical protein
LRDASDEHRLQPCFVQRFFKDAYLAAGGTITDDKHFPVFQLGRTPTAILEVARQNRLAVAEKYDVSFVFDKALASVASKIRVPEHTKLLGPGHPLFDTLLRWAIRRAQHAFFVRGVENVNEGLRGIWIIKRQRRWVRCLCGFWRLLGRRFEWIIAQVLYDARVERWGW